jgi:hypothetical protein
VFFNKTPDYFHFQKVARHVLLCGCVGNECRSPRVRGAAKEGGAGMG